LKISEGIADLVLSAADEKIIRYNNLNESIFEPPAEFINQANHLCNSNLHLFFNSKEEEEKYLVKNEKGMVEYRTETEGGQ
jgi:hypothetical protein